MLRGHPACCGTHSGGRVSIFDSRERLQGVRIRAPHRGGLLLRYLCLVYLEERAVSALSRQELDSLRAEAQDYNDALRRSGHYVASNALQPVQTATTIRSRDGRIFTTDGPFAETKEQLGGFMLIDARDLNDAIRVASRIPPGRLGCVEVRPVLELTRS